MSEARALDAALLRAFPLPLLSEDDGLEQLRQPLEREELALQRHQNGVGRRHGVDGDDVERGWAVDQHVAVAMRGVDGGVEAGQRGPQSESAVALLCNFELEARQIHGGGRDVQPRHRRFPDRLTERDRSDQDVVGRARPVLVADAKSGRSVGLRVKVDEHVRALSDRRKRGAEVDGRGGLADPALLVGQREDARMHRRRGRGRRGWRWQWGRRRGWRRCEGGRRLGWCRGRQCQRCRQWDCRRDPPCRLRLRGYFGLSDSFEVRIDWVHGRFPSRSARRTTTTRAFGSVRLGTSSAVMFQDFAASVNSASTSCPFGNSPFAPFFKAGDA